MAMVGALGWLVESNQGRPSRAANARNADRHRLLVESTALNLDIRQRQYVTRPCSFPAASDLPADWRAAYGAETAPTVVIWGDSYSNAWSPVFFRIADEQNLRIIRVSVGGCAPLVQTRRIDAIYAGSPCAQFGQAEKIVAALHVINPTQIFIIARWSLYTTGKVAARDPLKDGAGLLETQLSKTFDALPEHVPVVLFRTAPVLKDEPARTLLRGTRVEYLSPITSKESASRTPPSTRR